MPCVNGGTPRQTHQTPHVPNSTCGSARSVLDRTSRDLQGTRRSMRKTYESPRDQRPALPHRYALAPEGARSMNRHDVTGKGAFFAERSHRLKTRILPSHVRHSKIVSAGAASSQRSIHGTWTPPTIRPPSHSSRSPSLRGVVASNRTRSISPLRTLNTSQSTVRRRARSETRSVITVASSDPKSVAMVTNLCRANESEAGAAFVFATVRGGAITASMVPARRARFLRPLPGAARDRSQRRTNGRTAGGPPCDRSCAVPACGRRNEIESRIWRGQEANPGRIRSARRTMATRAIADHSPNQARRSVAHR